MADSPPQPDKKTFADTVRDAAVLAALTAAGDVAYVWDLASDKLQWVGSGQQFALLGGADALPDAAALLNRLHAEDRRVRQERMYAHVSGGTNFECEFRVRQSDGEFVWVHDRGSAVAGDKFAGVWRFVTARKTAERRLEHVASYDELTGFYNRKRLAEALDYGVTTSLRSMRPGAYLLVGVDKLTNVNDSFGDAVGDATLIEIGRRLEQTLRASDVLGRVGSDRFGVVLPECTEEQTAIAAERIIAAVNGQPILSGDVPIFITVSVGAVSFPEQARVAPEIMTRAEAALGEAKRAGRDCFAPYRQSEELRIKHRADMGVGEQVQRALREDRLVFAYQPVVDSTPGVARVDYYECLLRMLGPDGRPIAAAQFIPVIERLGFVRIIDRYVLERAVQEAADHPGQVLGFNISALTATDHSWLRAITRLLRDRPRVAKQLVVEITETAALSDIDEGSRFVGTLKELGCRVALDDFGAGFTSLRYLQALAVDIVKIDGSFVADLTTKIENQVFLRHLVGLAHGLGFVTVAEGVEGESQAAILRREGVKLLQGYHFARPNIDPPWTLVPAMVGAR